MEIGWLDWCRHAPVASLAKPDRWRRRDGESAVSARKVSLPCACLYLVDDLACPRLCVTCCPALVSARRLFIFWGSGLKFGLGCCRGLRLMQAACVLACVFPRCRLESQTSDASRFRFHFHLLVAVAYLTMYHPVHLGSAGLYLWMCVPVGDKFESVLFFLARFQAGAREEG